MLSVREEETWGPRVTHWGLFERKSCIQAQVCSSMSSILGALDLTSAEANIDQIRTALCRFCLAEFAMETQKSQQYTHTRTHKHKNRELAPPFSPPHVLTNLRLVKISHLQSLYKVGHLNRTVIVFRASEEIRCVVIICSWLWLLAGYDKDHNDVM